MNFVLAFVVLFAALTLSNLLTLLIASRYFARKAGTNFARGHVEFRNEQEKQYMRKRV